MHIAPGIVAVCLLGGALSGCMAVAAVGTVAGAATTVVGTAADIGSGIAGTAADTVSGGSGDDTPN